MSTARRGETGSEANEWGFVKVAEPTSLALPAAPALRATADTAAVVVGTADTAPPTPETKPRSLNAARRTLSGRWVRFDGQR